MNGKRAKRLRRLSANICKTILKIPVGEGYNMYNQAMNCRGWDVMRDKEGKIVFGPDGMALKKLVNTLPGTITTGWRFRTIYQRLKREYKKNGRLNLT